MVSIIKNYLASNGLSAIDNSTLTRKSIPPTVTFENLLWKNDELSI